MNQEIVSCYSYYVWGSKLVFVAMLMQLRWTNITHSLYKHCNLFYNFERNGECGISWGVKLV